MPNLSISIIGIGGQEFTKGMHVDSYIELAKSTKEGVYLNIVNMETADTNASRLFRGMDVYPSKGITFIRERF